MPPAQAKPQTIDEYIAGFPPAVQALLEQVRQAIKAAAPGAQETISYAMPAFRLNGYNLIYFAGYKQHIGVYPVPWGDEDFAAAAATYRTGKGTLQFPLDAPLPLDLLRWMVALRRKDTEERAAAKAKKR